jgi:hypothetical protein
MPLTTSIRSPRPWANWACKKGPPPARPFCVSKSMPRPSHAQYSWAFLQTFSAARIPLRIEWKAVALMAEKIHAAVGPVQRRFDDLNRAWSDRLQSLCGDTTDLNWSQFRPLRLSREEDWSDWLAWLLEASTTGMFAHILFGPQMRCPASALSLPTVEREPTTEDKERRGDILATWSALGIIANIEVKVWDGQLDKTFDTAKKLKAARQAKDWYDFILIPDELLPLWDTIAANHADDDPVDAITWKDVTHGLRSCLWQGRESLFWRVWAWTFCSAVEERILKLSKPNLLASDISRFQILLGWIDLLEINQGEIDA